MRRVIPACVCQTAAWPFFFVLLLVPAAVLAESEIQNRGLFWEVRQGNQQQYLLGSIHFADSGFYPLNTRIMSAWDASDVLVVEVDEATIPVAEQSRLVKQYGYYPDGESLLTVLDSPVRNELSALLNEFDLDLTDVQHWRPGMLVASLTAMQAQKLGYHADQGLDRYFLQKARYRRPIRQVESFEEQMQLLAALPTDTETLSASYRQMRTYEKTWHKTVSAWKSGDAEAMYYWAIEQPLQTAPQLDEFYQALFFDRHARMVAAIEQCFAREEVCFVVFGAGHMVGPKGIVAMLRQRDYEIVQH